MFDINMYYATVAESDAKANTKVDDQNDDMKPALLAATANN
jgi:hypothetical protein